MKSDNWVGLGCASVPGERTAIVSAPGAGDPFIVSQSTFPRRRFGESDGGITPRKSWHEETSIRARSSRHSLNGGRRIAGPPGEKGGEENTRPGKFLPQDTRPS